jgi:hypothetical protein
MAKVKASVLFTGVGFRNEGDSRPQYAQQGDVIELDKSEFDRLEGLGAVEKAGRGAEVTTNEPGEPDVPENVKSAVESIKASEAAEPVEETSSQRGRKRS